MYWSDLPAVTGTLFFPDRSQTQHSQTKLHKEDNLFSVKGMLMVPVVTAGVSDDVAQELQVPIGPQALQDVEEPMPSRPATLKTPRRWTCPTWLLEQPGGCVTWGMNAFVHTETKKEFISCCWMKWQKNVVLKDKTVKFYDKCR